MDYFIDGFADTSYPDTLRRYGVENPREAFAAFDVEHADLALVRAMVTSCAREDRFSGGALGFYAESGFLDRGLTRLKELDEG